jgi:hypothetical protein
MDPTARPLQAHGENREITVGFQKMVEDDVVTV